MIVKFVAQFHYFLPAIFNMMKKMKRKDRVNCFKSYHRKKGFLLWMSIVLFAIMYVNSHIVSVVRVNGQSMYPTISDGDILVVDRRNQNYSRGDIVLIRLSSEKSKIQYIVKRIIAVGGDTVNIDYESNEVFVNGTKLLEPYINLAPIDIMEDFGNTGKESFLIPEKSIFVLGDNRNISIDSRDNGIGFVIEKNILGQVRYILR